MNTLQVFATHKVFNTYYFEPFEFVYQSVIIKLEIKDKKIVITLNGKISVEEILKIFIKVYELLFLYLGGFPKRECVLANNVEINTSEWVRKYDTASRYIEKEARLCEISLKTINEHVLEKMSNVNYQTICSVEYIVCEYYSHIVTNHRIELIAHTIDGFLRHTIIYNQLLQELKKEYPKKWKIDYVESVERLFKCFFRIHQKYDCQILDCICVQDEHDFCQVIADTRNDFSHFLEDKQHRLIKGKDMVYFIDLIFYAERLFILEEILEIEILEVLSQEYLYILHDWIDEIVNQRNDRIKSERYKRVKDVNEFLKDMQGKHIS